MTDDVENTKHPAFGKIRIAHVSGRSNLFMVDYPQQHFIELKISTAGLRRELSNDWVFADREIVTIHLSEVQFARLISTPNTEGVPCTLDYYRDPLTGVEQNPKVPEKHIADHKTFSGEIDVKAKEAAAKVKTALAECERLLAGGPVKKGDLSKLKDLLYHANMDIAENTSFVAQKAEEAIEIAVESAKAEVDAHIDYAMARLGERALGDRLTAALEAGFDPKTFGRNLADAVTEKALPRAKES